MPRYRAFRFGLTFALVTICAALTYPATANDSTAELATGGLVFGKNNDVEMVSEELYISTAEINVRYHFLNKSTSDVDVLVAFPLPDLKMDSHDDVTVVPVDDPVNFVGFVTTINGHQVHAAVEQRAYLNDVEVTQTLLQLGIPLSPYKFRKTSGKSPATSNDQLQRLRLVNESGIPLWTLRTAFYWQQRFLSGQETTIEHRYKPSVGGLYPSEAESCWNYGKATGIEDIVWIRISFAPLQATRLLPSNRTAWNTCLRPVQTG